MLIYAIYDKNAGPMSGPIWSFEFDNPWNCFSIVIMIKKAIEHANKSGYPFEFKKECLVILKDVPQVTYYDEIIEGDTVYSIGINYWDENKYNFIIKEFN